MNNTKEKLRKIKPRKALFILLVIVMIIISGSFIFITSFFLITNLNNAFNSEPVINQDSVLFDKDGFQKLNLLKER